MSKRALFVFVLLAMTMFVASICTAQNDPVDDGASAAGTLEEVDIVDTNARVVQADIEATNGVIHVIDAVLMPTQVTET